MYILISQTRDERIKAVKDENGIFYAKQDHILLQPFVVRPVFVVWLRRTSAGPWWYESEEVWRICQEMAC